VDWGIQRVKQRCELIMETEDVICVTGRQFVGQPLKVVVVWPWLEHSHECPETFWFHGKDRLRTNSTMRQIHAGAGA
jgi:hypothetical protein